MDPKLAAVKDAAKYAVSLTYPSSKTGIKVVRARYQTVQGYNYDMDVAVTYVGNRSCSMQNYLVYASLATPTNVVVTYKLRSWTPLPSQKCRSK